MTHNPGPVKTNCFVRIRVRVKRAKDNQKLIIEIQIKSSTVFQGYAVLLDHILIHLHGFLL